MKKNSVTKKPEFGCDFCGRKFVRETSLATHMCETKRRWNEKDTLANRIGFKCWGEFYKRHTVSKKQKTHMEYVKSAYYSAFAKFGAYCVDVKVINPISFSKWLLDNNVRIDSWASDVKYTAYLIDYLKEENPLDALTRSIETTIRLAQAENIQACDYLRYGNKNKICYEITAGRISPWMVYQSTSGVEMLESLDDAQLKLILDYITPELWAVKFKRHPDTVLEVKTLLKKAGY